jgi:hypothetical protein
MANKNNAGDALLNEANGKKSGKIIKRPETK